MRRLKIFFWLENLTQQLLNEGELFLEDLEDKHEYHNRFTSKDGIQALAGLALRTRHRKRPLGAIF